MVAKVKKSDELEKALEQAQGAAVFLVDSRGNATHVVLAIADARRMFDGHLRRDLQEGFDDADRGDFVDWDAERIKSQGRSVLDRRSQSP